jgi:hypothetical protein
MQACAIGSIADIHARTLADGFQSLELLDGIFVVAAIDWLGWHAVSHSVFLFVC